jgi:hypothetical protein
VAAINGDYFDVAPPLVGDPQGLQIIRGELISGPGVDRAMAYLDAKGDPHLTNLVSEFAVTWPSGKTIPFSLNEVQEGNTAVLYTAAAGQTTRVQAPELVLARDGEAPWLPLRIGQTLTARIRRINNEGNSELSPDHLVLSMTRRMMGQLPEIKPGALVKISTATKPNITGAIMAIGGGPSLVRNGKIREFDGIQVRQPRTAFGWSDKYFCLVQVDGRQSRHSMGMTLPELAAYFVKLGCTEALNLDGGGSCTTWINGRIVNSPCQGRERPAANALVVVRTAKK